MYRLLIQCLCENTIDIVKVFHGALKTLRYLNRDTFSQRDTILSEEKFEGKTFLWMEEYSSYSSIASIFLISGTFFDIFLSRFPKWKIEGIKGVSPSLSLLEYFEFLGFDLIVHHPCADLFESDWLASRHEYHVNVRKQEHKVMRKLINFRRFSLFSWMCLLRVFALFSFACSLFHLALRSRIHQGGKISFLPSSPPLSLKRDIKYATRLFLWRALQVLLVSSFKGDFKFMKLEEFVYLCLVFCLSSCKSDLMSFYLCRADEYEKSLKRKK